MSSDEDDYDIMAPRRKSTLKSGLRVSNFFEDDPPSVSNLIIDGFRSNLNTRPQFLLDSEDNNDSDHETKPTRNFFDDDNDNNSNFLNLDELLESRGRKNTNESNETSSLTTNFLLNTASNSGIFIFLIKN